MKIFPVSFARSAKRNMVRKPMDLFWCKENGKCKTKQNILLDIGTGVDKL